MAGPPNEQILSPMIGKELSVEECLEWVRSFPYPECRSINNLSDMQSGIAFCQLVFDILYQRQKPDFLSRIMRNNNPSAQLINITTALNSIKDSSFDVPEKILSMQPQALCENNSLKYIVLSYLKYLQNDSSQLLNKPSPREQQQQQSNKNNSSFSKNLPPKNQSDETALNKSSKLNAGNIFFGQGSKQQVTTQSTNQLLIPLNSPSNGITKTNPTLNSKKNQKNTLTNSQTNFVNTLNSPVSPIPLSHASGKNSNILIDYSTSSSPNHGSSLVQWGTSSTTDIRGQGRVFHHQKSQTQISRFSNNLQDVQYGMSSQSGKDSRVFQQQINENVNSQLQTSVLSNSKKRKNVTLDLSNHPKQIQPSSAATGGSQSKSKQSSLSPSRKSTVKVVSKETKKKLYDWLVDMALFKDEFAIEKVDKLVDYGRNGAMLADLLNRLSGRTPLLFNNIFRGAKNASQVNVNYNKSFGFLKQLTKINKRYFNSWSVEQLKLGNIDIFWGLIDDIWHWHHHKASPYPSEISKPILEQPYEDQSRNSSSAVVASRQQTNYDKISINQEGKRKKQLEDSYSAVKQQKQAVIEVSQSVGLSQSNYQSVLSSSKLHQQQYSKGGSLSQSLLSTRQQNNINNSTRSNRLQQQEEVVHSRKSPIKILNKPSELPSDNYKDQAIYRKRLAESSNSKSRSSNSISPQSKSPIFHNQFSSQATARFKPELLNKDNNFNKSRHQSSYQSQNNYNASFLQPANTDPTQYPNFNLQHRQSQQLSAISPNNTYQDFHSTPIPNSKSKAQSILPSSNTPQILSSPNMIRQNTQPNFFDSSANYHSNSRAQLTLRALSPQLQHEAALIQAPHYLQKDIEKVCINWLTEIDFKQNQLKFFSSSDPKFMFQDEARNGLFLQSLLLRVGLWQPSDTFEGLYKRPNSIEECRYNLAAIIQVLEGNGIEIESKYKNPDMILSGNFNAFWQIIYAIKKRLSCGGEDSFERKIFSQLPYSLEQINQLEVSLKSWLANDILKQNIEDIIEDFKTPLQTGIFWASLVETITKNKLNNLILNPKQQIQCFSNITNAFACLKKNKNFGQRFLFKEDKLLSLDKETILGLLEDFRRYADGQPARQEQNYFKDGPYLGIKQIPPRRNSSNRLQMLEEEMESNKQKSVISSSKSQLLNRNASFSKDQHESSQNHTSLRNGSFQVLTSYDEPNQSRQSRRQSSSSKIEKQAKQENKVEEEKSDIKPQKLTNLFKNYVSPSKQQYSPVLDPQHEKHFFESSIKLASGASERKSPGKCFDSFRSGDGSDYLRDTWRNLNLTNLSTVMYQNSEGEIIEWLHLLGFGDFVSKVDFERQNLSEFKDGIFLANLISALEGKEIQGIILEPRHQSCCIHNIRKSLSLLQNKKDIEIALTDNPMLIFEAARPFIFSLLNNLKHVYRQKTLYYNNFNKSQSKSMFTHNMTMVLSPKKADELYYSKQEVENYILSKNEWTKRIIRPANAKI